MIDEIGCDMERGFIAIFIKLVGRKTGKASFKMGGIEAIWYIVMGTL